MIDRILPAALLLLASLAGAQAQSMVLGRAKPMMMPGPIPQYEEPDHNPPYTKGRNVLGLRADNPTDVRFCREYEAMITPLIGKVTDAFTEAYDPVIESSCSASGISKE
ncbi:hypothetical protein [Methylobacterium gregans]|uniref:hypothetical protein n=1 Tax=Methylobacterium gregans TaxID=374424 RepID=UPI00235D17B6|nr:hypothetical protein [Methylobacterium gregans]MDQ0523767.1 hypothetical protein [Methylobacterium gregans]GLS54789.1 hypothetical protein GCM10007886_29730 [Methylobacterium gregans]